MTIRHHVSDDLIVSYAAGALAEGWSVAVATHLALCPACRRRLATAETVGGELLGAMTAEPVSEESWKAVRARLDPRSDAPATRPPATPAGNGEARLPEPLRSYVGGDIDSLRWRSLGRGASQIHIKTADSGTKVRLLRIPAGKPVPEHGHGGRELTLVLSGQFRDGDAVFARGDIEDADGDLTHQPIATPEADCICLAVTDAPLRFRSWLVRAVQPLLDI